MVTPSDDITISYSQRAGLEDENEIEIMEPPTREENDASDYDSDDIQRDIDILYDAPKGASDILDYDENIETLREQLHEYKEIPAADIRKLLREAKELIADSKPYITPDLLKYIDTLGLEESREKRLIRQINRYLEADHDEIKGPVPDSVTMYMKEIGQYPLLKRFEEQKLAREIEDGHYIKSVKENLEEVLNEEPAPWEIQQKMVSDLSNSGKLIDALSDSISEEHDAAIKELIAIPQIRNRISAVDVSLHDILNMQDTQNTIPVKLRHTLQEIASRSRLNPTVAEMLDPDYLLANNPTVSELVGNQYFRNTIDGPISPDIVNRVADKLDISYDDAQKEIINLSSLSRVVYLGAIDKPHATRISELNDAPDSLSRIQRLNSLIRQYFVQLDNNSKRASTHLINSNLRLVVSNAKKYGSQGMSLLDLIQEGNIGLMRAVQGPGTRFDHRKGHGFATYASWWIRQHIGRAISNKAREIRIPVYMLDRINKVATERRKLTQELGREPSREEVAEATELTPEKIDELDEIVRNPTSIHMKLSDEGEGEVGDTIASEELGTYERIERRSEQIALKEALDKTLQTLDPVTYDIIRKRYGLDGGETRTLEAIAKDYGVTRQRIQQIHDRGLSSLRDPERSGSILEFLNAWGERDDQLVGVARRAENIMPEKIQEALDIEKERERRELEKEEALARAEERRREREAAELKAAQERAENPLPLKPAVIVPKRQETLFEQAKFPTKEDSAEQLNIDERRGRGRPKGSRNKPAPEKSQQYGLFDTGSMKRDIPKPDYSFSKDKPKKRKHPQLISNLMKQRPRLR